MIRPMIPGSGNLQVGPTALNAKANAIHAVCHSMFFLERELDSKVLIDAKLLTNVMGPALIELMRQVPGGFLTLTNIMGWNRYRSQAMS